MTASAADLKARVVAAQARASAGSNEPLIEHVFDAPVPPGWTCWRVNGSPVVLPALLRSAPWEVHLRYRDRIVGAATGTCPACGAVASINADPERTPAAWAVLEITVGLVHTPGCPAIFEEDDVQWFDQRSMLGRRR